MPENRQFDSNINSKTLKLQLSTGLSLQAKQSLRMILNPLAAIYRRYGYDNYTAKGLARDEFESSSESSLMKRAFECMIHLDARQFAELRSNWIPLRDWRYPSLGILNGRLEAIVLTQGKGK